MFLDSNGNLIGGDCNRPGNRGMNCTFLKSGSLSNVQGNGTSGTFSVVHWDGNQNGDYTITGSYDCSTSNYSSLAIQESGTVDYDSTATLTTSGTVTCQNYEESPNT